MSSRSSQSSRRSLPPSVSSSRLDATPPRSPASDDSRSARGPSTKRPRNEQPEEAPVNPVEACAVQFQVQGIRYEPHTNQLWCALCTTGKPKAETDEAVDPAETPKTKGKDATSKRGSKKAKEANKKAELGDTLPPLEDFLCVVGRTQKDVLDHCAGRDHLLRFEKARLSDLEHWCPVDLHGERMLLDHHCLYPRQMFGPGRMIMDETIAGGMLLGEDVCGGVKLWPRHHYTIVEMVLPQANSFVDRVEVCTQSGAGKHVEEVFYEAASVVPIALTEEELKLRGSRENNVRTSGVKELASFYNQSHGIRSRRVQASDLSQVLRDVNGFIRTEADFRKCRVKRFLKENL